MSKRKEDYQQASGKKARTGDAEYTMDVDTGPARPTLPRQLSILEPKQHADLPVVALRPRIEVVNDAVERVIISRLQRTPSPFTGKMGDHTVAWQALVDSVHAHLRGKSLAEAVTTLRERQNAVSGWMHNPASDGRKLLLQLEDAVECRPLLENAAYQVNTFLDGSAAAATPGGARQALEQAIAWHLTYVNYLPFATVPAQSARGSHGSAEGTYRASLLGEEKKGKPDGTADATSDVGALSDALWGMFAFEAALREARAELAVVPDSVTATGTTHQQLAKLARTCLLHIDTVLSRGPKTKAKVAYEWLNTPAPATQPAGRGTAQPPASGDKGHHPPLAT